MKVKNVNKINIILKIILSIYSYIVLCKNFGILKTNIQYNTLSLIIYIAILYLFLNTKISKCKKDNKLIVTVSIIISIILSFGETVYKGVYLTSNTGLKNIFTTQKILLGLIYAIGIFMFFYALLSVFLKWYKTINILESNSKKSTKVFITSWILIFLSYIPYFLRCYPAMMSPDSFYQINTVENKILSDLHPFVQTWFFGGIYSLGKTIFGPGNLALAFYTIIQMLILSFLFALVIKTLYKNNVNKIICIIILAFYCISPLHAYYSVTLWKDILFGGNFILLFIALFNLINEQKISLKNKNLHLLILSSLVLMFFRNNGIYVFFVMVPFMIYYFKQNRKLISLLSISLIIMYYVIKGPIFALAGISSTRTVESYSIPLQQVARTISLNGKISNKEKETLNKLFYMEQVKENYVPYISDPIKNSVNAKYFANHQSEFINVWIKLLIKNPQIYIESYMSSTLGYWYPNVIYHATSFVGSATEEYNAYKFKIDNAPKGNKAVNKMIDYANARVYPFANLFWSVGLACLLMFFGLALTLYNSSKNKYVVCYAPFIGLWITMMIATPVFSELRYIYGIFTCIPLLILLPFFTKNNVGEKNER